MMSEEELRRAAIAWEQDRLEQLPEPQDCNRQFSPQFEREMKKLIRRTDHPLQYWLGKAVACLLLAVCLGSSILLFNSDARAAFFGWSRKVFDTFLEYRYTGENVSAPKDVVYLPTWIPDGYEVMDEIYGDTGEYIIYITKEGNLAYFVCNIDNEGTNLHIVGEVGETQQTYVGKYSADLYFDAKEGENNALVWIDEQRNALFAISAPVGADELIKMAESIEDIECSQEDK